MKSNKLDNWMDEIVEDMENPIIKNRKALYPTYYTDIIQHREKEIYKVTKCVAPILKNEHIKTNLLLYGVGGTGKTHVIKNIINTRLPQLAKKIHSKGETPIIHIDCKGITETVLLRRICDNLLNGDYKTHTKSVKELYNKVNSFTEEKKKHVLLFLDDLDKTTRNTNIQCLSQFSRMDVSFVFACNDLRFLSNPLLLRESSLSYDKEIFLAYKADQLKDILLDRVKEALTRNPFSERALQYICDETDIAGGDARHAIDWFRQSVFDMNGSNIDISTTKQALKHLEKKQTEEYVDILSIGHIFALITIFNLSGERVDTSQSYQLYKVLCAMYDLNPVKIRPQYWRYLADLDACGLIKHVKTVSDMGKGISAKWYIDPEINKEKLKKSIEKKIEDILRIPPQEQKWEKVITA